MPLETQNGDQKSKPGVVYVLPELGRNGTDPKLISDTFEYLEPSLNAERRAQWQALLERCERETDVDLRWVIEAADRVAGYPPDRENKQRVVFKLASGVLVTDLPAIARWWQGYHAERFSVDRGVCFVTAAEVSLAGRVEKVKGVPGAGGAGGTLTTVYRPSFQSYGQADSPYVGYEANHYARTAIEYLLRKPERSLKFGNTAWVSWGESESSELDVFGLMDGTNDTNNAEQLIQYLSVFSPKKAERGADHSASLHVACLRGAQGRITVSHYSQHEPTTIATNLTGWYEAQIATFSGEKLTAPNDKRLPVTFGLYSLVQASLPEGAKVAEHTGDIAALMRSALFARPLPSLFALRLLGRFAATRSATRSQRVLLNLYLSRIMMTDDHTIARLHGRLLALYGKAQEKALNVKLAETMAFKAFARYSQTPHVLAGRLAAAMIPWQQRLASHAKGSWPCGEIAKIHEEIDRLRTPLRFTNEQRAVFASAFFGELAFKEVRRDESTAEVSEVSDA
jgi:hypothetical protein